MYLVLRSCNVIVKLALRILKYFFGVFFKTTSGFLTLFTKFIRLFWRTYFFLFFLQVVLGGIIEIVVQTFTGYSFGISVLRSLRLLRIFKFTRWESQVFHNVEIFSARHICLKLLCVKVQVKILLVAVFNR